MSTRRMTQNIVTVEVKLPGFIRTSQLVSQVEVKLPQMMRVSQLIVIVEAEPPVRRLQSVQAQCV